VFQGILAEECAESGGACAVNQQSGQACHDCDGQGSVGTLPCGRCAGSGVEPTSKGAAGVLEGIRTDFGAMGSWRSREWLLGLAPLRAMRRVTG
jgi:hypothetical protein